MNGILAVNAFLKGEKFDILHNHIVSAAQSLGITLKIKNNQELLFSREKPDFVLFWDKDVNLAKTLENRGIPVFNSARAISLCDDKAKTYLTLENEVAQPKTLIAPFSFFITDYSDFVNQAIEALGLPLVFKECCGSFGEQVFLCGSAEEIMACITDKPFLLQEYIEGGNEDVRLEIVGGRCVAAMKRTNLKDFRSNVTNGGTAEPYTPTTKEFQLAVKACALLGLDFGGVDILNHSLVCEVNSNAHIINLMKTTGIDPAPEILKQIIETI
ncbi:MAG: RimK family alpha-L-glutamate ligase [Eubacterium sp.]|nr:RimK family alpha-L-glutamate ligase [Eubacterium sp.]